MIGERLSDLRKDKGLKQTQLAALLKISVHTLSNYETGKSEPDDSMKISIAYFFNVSLDFLLGIVNEQIPIHNDNNQVVLPDNLPIEAINEIKNFINYTKHKY